MKRSLFNIICLVFCGILLSGCGVAPVFKNEKVNIRKVINIELSPLDEAQSRDMINYMSAGRACSAEGKLYTMEFTEKLEPCLGTYNLEEGSISGFELLAEDCVPEFLQYSEGRLYFINSGNNSSIESINADGSDRKTIKDGPCDFLRAEGGSIYYCDSNMRYCKASIDGSGEQIISPQGCYYPYILEDKLLYQKSGSEHLYLYDFTDGSDMEITDIPAYAPVIINDRLYCTTEGGIFSADLQGMEPLKYELSGIQGTVQYFPREEGVTISGLTGSDGIHSFSFNTEDVGGSYRKTPGGGYRVQEYLGEDFAVYTDFEPTGRVKSFAFSPSEGENIRYIKGEIR